MSKSVALAALAAVLAGGLPAQGGGVQPAPAEQQKPKVLKLGSEVPADLKLQTLDGKEHAFGDFRGKVVFIHFWSVKCPWEKYAEPKIVKMEKDYAKKDVVILAINSNQNELGAKPDADAWKAKDKPYSDLRSHAKKNELGHTILVDHGNALSSLFQAKTTPHCFVIDQEGKLRYAGGLDNDAADRDPENAKTYVRDAIDALLAGEEVEVTSSRPYG